MRLPSETSRASCVAFLSLAVAGVALAEDASRYWTWGWGAYGISACRSDGALDVARFDWSYICFGNESADQRAVDRCNEILKLNPKHRFVIRVWPIMSLGDCPQNSYQATLFHYLYVPGVKDKLLTETHRQIELIVKGISNPNAVVGGTFLEELPGHFTSCPFGDTGANWKKGDPLPWDIQRFQKDIQAELGEPFDLRNEKHRLWWGGKYVRVLTEIHQVMREALGGRPVIYYQSTCYSSMDCAGENPAVKPEADARLVPIYYKDIVRPGGADGFFGYPNNARIWEQQTQKPAQKLRCPIFSQVSAPPGMRLCTMEDNVALARWDYPLNLGSFFFADTGRRTRAWNELRYQDDSCWTITDHMRRFGWEHKINMDVVNRGLSPLVALDYRIVGLKRDDVFHVQAQIWNRRHPSWYGGSIDLATLKNVKVTLKTPAGFSIPSEKSGEETLSLAQIAPQDARVADWWVRLEKDDATVPPGQSFQVTVVAADGTRSEVVSSAVDQSVPELQDHLVIRSGDRWIEPAYRMPSYRVAAELESLGTDILFPELEAGGRRVLYRDTLRPKTRLVIGPGARAMLFARSPFDEQTRRFAPHKPGPDGAVEFKEGYKVFDAGGLRVRSGERYRFQVTGWAKDGGNCLVIARVQGTEAGKRTQKDLPVLANCFTDKASTVESGDIVVPQFEGAEATMAFFFYRFQSKGTVYYQSFDCRRADIPVQGLDVSARLEGALADLAPPLTVWTYKDLSDPSPSDSPALRIRFLKAAEAETPGQASRS